MAQSQTRQRVVCSDPFLNLELPKRLVYAAPQMFLTPYSSLAWSYQLHYYLCFGTHRRRELFTNALYANSLAHLIEEISSNHEYHLLEQKSYPTQLRCLLSFKPSQSCSEAIRLLKCNSARELAQQFNISVPVWATGYLARSSGGVRISEVQRISGTAVLPPWLRCTRITTSLHVSCS